MSDRPLDLSKADETMSDLTRSSFIAVATPDFGPLFASLSLAGVRFVVLRNYESLPKHTENDLDMEVCAKDRRLFEATLFDYSRGDGFRLFRRVDRPHVTMFKFFRTRNGRVELMMIDAQYDGFSWIGLPYLHNAEIVSGARGLNGFKVCSQFHELLSKLLLNMLTGSTVPVKYLPELAKNAAQMQSDVVSFFSSRFPSLDAEAFVKDVSAGNATRLKLWIPRLKRSLILASFAKAPIVSAINMMATWRAELTYYRRRPGLFIVLIGPDGVGKTTLAEAVIENMKSVFKRRRYLHWIRGPLGGWAEPGTAAPSRRSTDDRVTSRFDRGVLSPLRIIRNGWRAILGYAVRIYPELIRDRLVVGDRYIYGYVVDPEALDYHGPKWLVSLVLHMVPNPDLIFALRAPASVVHQRKPELSCAEIEGVYERLSSLPPVTRKARIVWVDADQDRAGVLATVTHSVLEFIAERDVPR